jgi:hypothetical protein
MTHKTLLTRKAFLTRVVPASTLLLCGCGGTNTKTENAANRTALNNAKAKWATRNVTSYEYVFQRGMFAPLEVTRKVRIRVDNGIASSVTSADSNTTPIARVLFDNYDTMDKLFVRVSDKIALLPETLVLTFDTSYGYLSALSFDRYAAIADDEETYTISEFKVL